MKTAKIYMLTAFLASFAISAAAQSSNCVTGDGTAQSIVYKVDGQIVAELNGKVKSGSKVQVTFRVAGSSKTRFSLVSYTAPSAGFSYETADQQRVFKSDSRELAPNGTYTLSVIAPDCYFQVDFVKGCVIEQFGPENTNNYYGRQNRLIAAANGGSHHCSAKDEGSDNDHGNDGDSEENTGPCLCDNDGDGKADADFGSTNYNSSKTLKAQFAADGKQVVVTSTDKDISNIVVKYEGAPNHKHDGLSGKSYTITSDEHTILGVWVKAGGNVSGDGPGYGEFIANKNSSENPNQCTCDDEGQAGGGDDEEDDGDGDEGEEDDDDKDKPKKVTICHIPPGNPENAHTITISENAWKAHHQNHGDYMGECREDTVLCPCDNDTSVVTNTAGDLEVEFSGASQVTVTSENGELASITIVYEDGSETTFDGLSGFSTTVTGNGNTVKTVCVKRGENKGDNGDQELCPKTIGYWKNHDEHLADVLAKGSIDLGDRVVSTVEEAHAVLDNANAEDARVMLRAQLLATLLNLNNGSSPTAGGFDIRPVTEDAIDFLRTHSSPVEGGHPDREEALALKDKLDDYNNTQDCEGNSNSKECVDRGICDCPPPPSDTCPCDYDGDGRNDRIYGAVYTSVDGSYAAKFTANSDSVLVMSESEVIMDVTLFFEDGGVATFTDVNTTSKWYVYPFQVIMAVELNGNIVENLHALDPDFICECMPDEPGEPVPVSLTKFTGEKIAPNVVYLEWETASEVNNDYMAIEKSVDINTWREVCRVPGHGTTNDPHSYNCVDNNANEDGQNLVYYRPKQVDLNGAYEYFDMIRIRLQDAAYASTVDKVYPNPTTGQLYVTYNASENGIFSIRLLSIDGKVLMTSSFAAKPGVQTTDINLAEKNLRPGLYVLEVKNDNEVFRQKVYKQ